MAANNQKSIEITDLDAVPIVQHNTGSGQPGPLRAVGGYVTAAASASAGSIWRLARIPSNAKVKHVILESEAQGAGAVNVSVYYSDSTQDGTTPANQGVIVPTTGDQFFASDVNIAAAYGPTDVINESGNNTLDKRNKALWDALGLASDPGGFFDICAVVHTTAITTGTGKVGLEVQFVE